MKTLGARGEGDVFEERQDLDRGDPESDQDGDQRRPEPERPLPCPAVPSLLEREVQREQTSGDERVIRELEVAE